MYGEQVNANKIVLFIGLVWPESKSSAAGKRICDLICFFKTNNFNVHFVSSALKSDYSDDLNGVVCSQIELNSTSFNEFIVELNPEIVVFDRFVIEEQYSWRVRESCPNAITILDSEDLHLLRFARQKAIQEKRIFSDTDLYNQFSYRELASVLRTDISLIISEFEIQLLKEKFNIHETKLFYLPFIENNWSNKLSNFLDRKNFTFIGNFHHEPNCDAVIHLKTKIWPLIRKLNNSLQIEIYGAYMPPKILNLHNEKEGFLIKGRVEEAKDVFDNHRVFLAPLRFGAGQKGKLLEAMRYGIPSITTTIGSESMAGDYPWNGYVTDSDQEFALKAVELNEDEISWNKFVLNGYKIIENRFSKDKFESDFIQKISSTKQNLKLHRRTNFIGEILFQNQFNSSKYLSKWIEEKNKA